MRCGACRRDRSRGELFFLLELLDQVADHRPLRMPEDETGADLLVDREVELAPKTAMIAALGLFQPRQMGVSSSCVGQAVP